MDSPSCSGNLDGDQTPKRNRHADGKELLSALLDGDHGGKDLTSALRDELLIAILERVDSRTAVSTSALSRRWRRLDPAGSLSAFEFSVATHLPPEHAGAVDKYRDARARGGGDDLSALAEWVGRCEDRAMAAFVRGLFGFLSAPDRCPRARSLRLEFFVTPLYALAGWETALCLASAVHWPGIERLAIDAVPSVAAGREQQPHLFPKKALLSGLVAHALTALRVTNCFLCTDADVYGTAFPALSRLTVEVTPLVALSFEGAYFNDLMRACQQLECLRLVSCDPFGEIDGFTVDLPPASMLRELVIETCDYREVNLVKAPSLESLVLERCNCLRVLSVESAPRLERLVCRGSVPMLSGTGKASLRFVELCVLNPSNGEYRLPSFFKGIPNVEELTLCFRGRMVSTHKYS
jgi:hypothetical protein